MLTYNQELKKRIESIKKDYNQSYQSSKAEHKRMDWLSWLVKASNLGNIEALDVLRSRKDYQSTVNNISGAQDKEADEFVKRSDVIDTITRTGTLILNTGSTTIRDAGDKLLVLSGTAKDKILDVLKAAIKRFGNKLAVNGTASFREEVVQVAAETNLDVTFDDAALEQRRLDILNKKDQGLGGQGVVGQDLSGQDLSGGEKNDSVNKDKLLKQKTQKRSIKSTRKGRSR